MKITEAIITFIGHLIQLAMICVALFGMAMNLWFPPFFVLFLVLFVMACFAHVI